MLTPLRRTFRKRKDARRIREEREVQLPGTELVFLFQRDGCRTLRLSVRPDGSVRVKAPARLSLEQVLAFVRSRLDWVRAKRDFFASHRGASAELCEGGTILYLGRTFTLRCVPAVRNARPRLTGGVLELPCLRPGNEETDTGRALERAFSRWRLETAKLVLGRRLARMEARARAVFHDDAAVSRLTVRSLKRRWGSCSVRGDITLAAELIALPLPLIDYVLCHELCHLRAMNHGPAFHALLKRLLPDAEAREKDIRIWSLEHPR